MPRITTKPFAEVRRLMLPSGQPLSRSAFANAMDRHERAASRMTLLWDYYRNRMDPGAGRGRALTLAQERGLPARVTGTWDRRTPAARFVGDDRAWQRKEVVIENDIAWRIQTMVDFMFGRPITIASTAADPTLRRTIEYVLEAVWESSGGIALLQDLGLMGHVYGHVDLLVRAIQSRVGGAAQAAGVSASNEHDEAGATPREPLGGGESGGEGEASIAERAVSAVRIELIEPSRGVALPGESDYREIDGYFIRTQRESREEAASRPVATLAESLMRWLGSSGGPPPQPLRGGSGSLLTTTEVFAGSTRQLYETDADGHTRIIDEGPALVDERPGDRPPIVHIQNISQPFEYSGLGEVEPLIPLQDELNTRLSDRAARVTMQSFKMYLAKGLDGASAMPIAPGVIWSTDNTDAQITAFGGDAASPSEDRHIDEIREAMDKASAVPPLASGVVRAKIGNLSSENALRITLLGLMSKTSRKRITYGRGIVRTSQLILEALDRLGILRTTARDRALRIDWVDPIPRDEQSALLAAQKKVDLGVPRERVLSELGYANDEVHDTAID